MITVKVLKRHVEKAKKLQADNLRFYKPSFLVTENCPIALAIKEKQKKKVGVTYVGIYIKKLSYITP